MLHFAPPETFIFEPIFAFVSIRQILLNFFLSKFEANIKALAPAPIIAIS